MEFGNPPRCRVHDDRPDAPIRKPLRPVANSVTTNHWLKSRVNRLFTVNPGRSGSRIGSRRLRIESFKGRVQKTRPCSFTARGLRSVAPKRAFPATNADVSVHRRSRLALSGSPRSVAAISEARCILGVFAPNSRRRERVPPSGLQRGCGNGLTVPEFGTACGGRRRRAKSVGSGETRWLQPRQRSHRLPRWQ